MPSARFDDDDDDESRSTTHLISYNGKLCHHISFNVQHILKSYSIYFQFRKQETKIKEMSLVEMDK